MFCSKELLQLFMLHNVFDFYALLGFWNLDNIILIIFRWGSTKFPN